MWDVLLLAPVEEWFLAVCESDPTTANRVMEAIDHLAEAGPGLGAGRWSTVSTAVGCTT